MYMIIQTALVAKEIFLKELGSVIPRLQDEKTLPVLTSFAMDSTTLYSWVWLLSSGNCLYLSFTFHDWKIGLLSGYPAKLEVINDSQIFEQGGVVLELCSSWELPIEDGDWFSLMGGTYVVKMSEMIVVSMVDKFRFVHDCGNWVISGCRVAVILCNWELSRENTGMRQLYVWRDFFVEGKFHKKCQFLKMQTSYRKTVGAISTIRLSNPRLRNMLSLQMTIIPSNVRSTNFSEEKSWFASAS